MAERCEPTHKRFPAEICRREPHVRLVLRWPTATISHTEGSEKQALRLRFGVLAVWATAP
jgi:hypothetical protein